MRTQKDRSIRAPLVAALAALVRAFVLGPLYFLLLTLFGLWPWRAGPPYGLLRPLRLTGEARDTLVLRALAHRLLLRDERLLRDGVRWLVRPYRLRRWLRSPWSVTARSCARFARAEMRRTGRSGVAAAVKIYADAVVDSYRCANGTVHRDWFDLERRPLAPFHLPNEHHIRVCCYLLNHKLNPQMPIEQRHYDKGEFHRQCETHGLPTVPVYAVIEAGECTRLAPVPEVPLISKPADLAEGKGTFMRWTPAQGEARARPSFCDDDGRNCSLEEIFDVLKSQSREGPYLLQRRIFNHVDIRELSGNDTLSSLRVTTCRFPDGRVQVLPFCFLRLPTRADVPVDNLARGAAIAYPFDAATGRLGTGGKYGSFERFDVHPATGQRITGYVLPYWRESVDLCRKAHAEVFSTFPTLGWDVAITEQGPVLLEMNIQWVRPVGLPDEVFTGQSAYVACILAHMARVWPRQMPPTQAARTEP